MNFLDAVATALRKFVTFSGRAGRSEYWFFLLFVNVLAFGGAFIGESLASDKAEQIANLIYLVFLLPSLALACRRLHDLGKSGWLQLLYIIPIIGFILWLVWNCSKGNAGDNRFGPDPVRE